MTQRSCQRLPRRVGVVPCLWAGCARSQLTTLAFHARRRLRVLCTLLAVTETLLSPDDLAALIQVPVKTLYNWRWEGKGPKAIKLGKHLRFRRADVEAWLEQMAD